MNINIGKCGKKGRSIKKEIKPCTHTHNMYTKIMKSIRNA